MTKPYDVLIPTSADDSGVMGVRIRPDTEPEAVKVYPFKDGKPISTNGELVSLHSRPNSNTIDLKPLDEEEGKASHEGPARVTTDAYRTGWESIFGESKGSGELN